MYYNYAYIRVRGGLPRDERSEFYGAVPRDGEAILRGYPQTIFASAYGGLYNGRQGSLTTEYSFLVVYKSVVYFALLGRTSEALVR